MTPERTTAIRDELATKSPGIFAEYSITNAEVIELIDALATMNGVVNHQTNRVFGAEIPSFLRQVHPLTCGNDSNHTPLYPYWTGEKVVLRCRDCDYEQGNTGPVRSLY